MKRMIQACDLFCGAGGTSSGLAAACRSFGLDVDLLAINHWNVAIQSHWANHPWARHLCQNLEAVDPTKVVPSGYLDLLVASPECTYFSVARGGRPVEDQLRASAWQVLRWAERLYIKSILIENVPEFAKWGPVDQGGAPIKEREGETFRALLQALRSLDYTVDHKVLTAADYGDATTRRRLFIMARKGKDTVVWPEPSHAKAGKGGLKPWRTAREIIDWTNPGKSIFERQKPLAKTTLARIEAGLQKFCGFPPEPFLVKLYGTSNVAPVDGPLPTVTATGQHLALCNPFLLGHRQFGQDLVDGVDRPLRTITTKTTDVKVVQPFIVGVEHTGAHGKQVRDAEAPLPTVSAHSRMAVCNPFVVGCGGPARAGEPKSVDRPLDTVLTRNHKALISPDAVLVKLEEAAVEGVRATPFLVKYYGTGKAQSVDRPLDTVTTKPRFALCVPLADGKHGVLVDILFRMLEPKELAAAMSFPKEYQFSGPRSDQIKQIGNAVPCELARSLCTSLLEHLVPASGKGRRRKAA